MVGHIKFYTGLSTANNNRIRLLIAEGGATSLSGALTAGIRIVQTGTGALTGTTKVAG